MSVKMAMAKLCACACGGAIIGGGAVHVAEQPRPRIHHPKTVKRQRIAPRQVAQRPVARQARSLPTACVTDGLRGTVSTIASRAPLPPIAARDAAYDRGPYEGGSSGSRGAQFIPAVGGSGGFGGSGFLGGGFFGGGSGGGGGSIVVTSISSGGSTSTSSGGSGGSSTSTSTSGGNLSSTSSSSGNVSTSSASSTSTSTSSSGNVSTSTSTSTSGGGHHHPHPPTSSGDAGDPHAVPAPPMVLLFGLGATALVIRGRFAAKAS